MKKLLPILLAFCAISAFLSGCESSNQENLSLENAPTEAVGDTDMGDSGTDSSRDTRNVKFKYDLPKNEQTPVDIYKYYDPELSMDSYIMLFSADPELQEETFPNGYRQTYTIGDEIGYITVRNEVLDSLQYGTEQGYNYAIIAESSGSYDEETEFDFISREEISKQLSETVKELLGIEIQAQIDGMTAERFRQEVEEHINFAAQLYDDPPTAEKYGEPADFYHISFVQTIEGVPVSSMFGYAVFTDKGMENLSVFQPIRVGAKVPNLDKFISQEKAEALLKEKYDMLLLDNPVEVLSGELVYIIDDGNLIPVWEFDLGGGYYEYYGAYTGKEIVANAGQGA